eukprot:3472130-Alexandrium_andersonii.AAC.1
MPSTGVPPPRPALRPFPCRQGETQLPAKLGVDPRFASPRPALAAACLRVLSEQHRQPEVTPRHRS